MPSTIDIWCPSIERAAGGIQSFSYELCKAIQNIPESHNVRIFSRDGISQKTRSTLTTNATVLAALQGNKLVVVVSFLLIVLWYILLDRPRLIIVTHIKLARLAKIIKIIFRCPYIVALYGIDVWANKDLLIKKTLESADMLLPISKYTSNIVVRENSVPIDRITLFPCTYDEGLYVPSDKPTYLMERYGLTLSNILILTVCRLVGPEREKGYDQVIRALPRLLSIIPNLRYMIVGKGSDAGRIQQLARQLGVSDKVILTGFVESHELAAHYQLCDIFVMPSKKEGFGIVFLEAMACGKPVISGNVDGSVDPLRNGELGTMINPDDQDALVEAVLRILDKQPHGHVMFRPEELNIKVRGYYGRRAFRDRLRNVINSFVDPDIQGSCDKLGV